MVSLDVENVFDHFVRNALYAFGCETKPRRGERYGFGNRVDGEGKPRGNRLNLFSVDKLNFWTGGGSSFFASKLTPGKGRIISFISLKEAAGGRKLTLGERD